MEDSQYRYEWVSLLIKATWSSRLFYENCSTKGMLEPVLKRRSSMIRIIIFLNLALSLFSSNVYGCKVQTAEVETVAKNPTLAKTIVIGRVEKLKDEYIFRTEKSWGKNLPYYTIDLSSTCAPHVLLGKRYLFLSLHEFDITRTAGFPMLNIGTGYFVEVSTAKEFIKLLAKKTDNFSETANPAWSYCVEDNECSGIKNQCGSFLKVNKNYEKIYLDFLKLKSLKTDCSKKNSSYKNQSKCVDNFCS